jgi:hypothetical protein
MNTRNLYDLSTDQLALLDRLVALMEETGGESTPDSDEILDALELSEESVKDKMDAYCAVIGQLEADSKSLVAYADELLDKAKRIKSRAQTKLNTADRLKERMVTTMDLLGQKTIETDKNRITLAISGAQSVIIEEGVMADFVFSTDPNGATYVSEKTTYTFDKTGIKKAIQDGSGPNWATLSEKKKYIKLS